MQFRDIILIKYTSRHDTFSHQELNIWKEGNVYLMTHSTHFIYGYMALDIGEGPLR